MISRTKDIIDGADKLTEHSYLPLPMSVYVEVGGQAERMAAFYFFSDALAWAGREAANWPALKKITWTVIDDSRREVIK